MLHSGKNLHDYIITMYFVIQMFLYCAATEHVELVLTSLTSFIAPVLTILPKMIINDAVIWFLVNI